MGEKKFTSTRIVQKHDTESNWNKATNFIPMKGELIIYDADENYNSARFKVGDGETLVSALPFVTSGGGFAKILVTNSDGETYAEIDSQDTSNILPIQIGSGLVATTNIAGDTIILDTAESAGTVITTEDEVTDKTILVVDQNIDEAVKMPEWHQGTLITGQGVGLNVEVSGSGKGDFYLNTDTFEIYYATASNIWDYKGCIKPTNGANGISPTLDVTEIDGGHIVTITDVNGVSNFNVKDGITIYEYGRVTISAAADKITQVSVVYEGTYTTPPRLLISMRSTTTSIHYGQITPFIYSYDETGFTVAVANDYTSAFTPVIEWIAFGPVEGE